MRIATEIVVRTKKVSIPVLGLYEMKTQYSQCVTSYYSKNLMVFCNTTRIRQLYGIPPPSTHKEVLVRTYICLSSIFSFAIANKISFIRFWWIHSLCSICATPSFGIR